MSIQFVYHSPTTPGNPGFSINLGDQAVRLGDIPGLQTEAELGAVGTSSLRFDDPTATAGNAGDAILGLKQLSVNASLAPSGNRRIGEYYIGDRRYYRGVTGSSPSLRTEAARIIDMTLVDINAFLSFRIFRADTDGSNTSFNRAAETDVARVTAMLAVSFISDTLFDGLVSTDNPVDMDACDYTGQRPADVLNDCAQQSGKNFFVFYDESGTYTPSPGDYALFYDKNDTLVYTSSMQVSNVLDDVDNSVTWAPLEDAILTRDPSRVMSGAFWQNGSNSVYVEEPTTSYKFGWRDAVFNSPNLKTETQATARATRYLAENATEDDRITFTVRLPEANVNDWKEGQAGKVRFSHLPGYETSRWVRALTRTVIQDEETDQFLKCRYEATPMAASAISGAFSAAIRGIAFSGVPILPHPTTPGNVLLMALAGQGAVTQFPTDVRMSNDPPITGSPPVPPYPTHDGWTVIATATTDYSGQITGGPGANGYLGPFNGGAGSVFAGLITAWAWRYVLPGERTTHPVAVSTEILDSFLAAWLWELPTTLPPTGVFVSSDGAAVTTGSVGPTSATNTLAPLSGNVAVLEFWATSGGHIASVQPSAQSTSGVTINAALPQTNDTTIPAPPNQDDYAQIYQLASGGAGTSTVHVAGGGVNYNQVNHCEVAIVLPPGIVLPTIPFPANQVG